MRVEPKVLIAKLNPVCRKAFEHAAQLCVRHTNYDVEVEHLFRAVLDLQETDIHVVLRHFEVEESKLEAELTKSIDGFKRGNTRTPAFSPNIPRLLEQAWSVSSLYFRSDQIRSASLLLAALSDLALRGTLQESAPSLLRIPRESLEENAPELVRYSPESGPSTAPPRGTLRRARPPPIPPQRGRWCPVRRHRSDPRARRGNPADRGHPHAATAEQSHPHG